jgi:hypothetical protein
MQQQLCSIDWCDNPRRIGVLCLAHHGRLKRHGHPLGGNALPGEPQAFLRHAVGAPTDNCILWPFALDRLGYGRLVWGGAQMPAHRAAWELYNGRKMAPEMDACHAPEVCHNRSCINPQHIREDTRPNNMADTLIDGTSPRGTKSHSAKLSEDDVRAIRADTRGHRDAADAYGVSYDTVRSIRCGRRWGWLK